MDREVQSQYLLKKDRNYTWCVSQAALSQERIQSLPNTQRREATHSPGKRSTHTYHRGLTLAVAVIPSHHEALNLDVVPILEIE